MFGSQYLRGMTPDRFLWERDMELMQRMGFNTIRAWLVWGVLEPARGKIDFGYIDELLETALKHQLQVGLLFHLHGCPEWAISDYPQYWYVNAHGQRFESSQRANTPSGGWPGLCPDFPDVKLLEASFIERIAAHVDNHPALAFWEPINEPHMWVDLAENPPGAFCYCEGTRQAFRMWLRRKYSTLEALGDAWGRRFSDWDHVRPPTWKFGYTDTVDFRTFTAENIAVLVDRRAKLIRQHSSRPVIAHAWGGGCVTCSQLGSMAFDDWKNAVPVDKWGYSAFPEKTAQTVMVGLGTDATRNASQGKEFWQSELGAGDYGAGFSRQGRIPARVQEQFCWESIRHGAKGLLFWQFRKEAHGHEIGAFGLTDYKGNETENLRAVARIGKILNTHDELFTQAQVRPAPVALVFSYRSYMAEWADRRNCKLGVDSLSGYYRMFWDQNITVDVLHDEFTTLDMLKKYKLVILPMPVALAAPFRPLLAQYISDGGTVLSDPYLCSFNDDMSMASEIPGAGLSHVFGCTEEDITQAAGSEITLTFRGKVLSITGSHFREHWQVLPGAETLATYANGEPAIVSNAFGDGRSIISGLNLGLSYSTRQGVGDDIIRDKNTEVDAVAGDIVMSIAREAGVKSEIETPDNVRASLLSTEDGQHVLIALNMSEAGCEGKIRIDGVPFENAVDLYTEEQCDVHDSAITLKFEGYESRILELN